MGEKSAFCFLLKFVDKLFITLAVVSTGVMVILTASDTILRYFFNYPIPGSYEITQEYLLVVTVFMGMGYAYKGGAYIRVTLLVDHLPKWIRDIINYFSQAFSILVCLMTAIATIPQTIYNLTKFVSSSSFDLPLGAAYVVVSLGLLYLSFLLLLDFRKVKTGESALFKEEMPNS